MINFLKLFPQKGAKLIKLNNIIFFSFCVLFLAACTQKAPPKEYVAKVNNQYLTEADLKSMMSPESQNHQYKNEIIREWINREVLYQEAVKQGILKDKEFKRISEQSEKEIAGSLLLQKMFSKQNQIVKDSSLYNFYKENMGEFKLFYDAYLINQVVFKNEKEALRFHSIVLEENWNSALDSCNTDTSLISNNQNRLLYDYQVHSIDILKIIKELLPNEISIVVKDAAGNYDIVQLLKKYDKNSILPLDLVKSRVKERYLMRCKDSLINNYIKSLYSSNKIEVKN